MLQTIKSEAEIELEKISKEYFQNIMTIEKKSHINIRNLIWASSINQIQFYGTSWINCFVENLKEAINHENTPAKIKGFYKKILKDNNIELQDNLFKVKFIMDNKRTFKVKNFKEDIITLEITDENIKLNTNKLLSSLKGYFDFLQYDIEIFEIYFSRNEYNECTAITIFFKENKLPYKIF